MKSRIERNERKAEDRQAKKAAGERPIATNRKAFHEYFIEEKLEAGIVLTGTEVKSLRDGRASLTDGYVGVDGGEAWLQNVHISPYDAGSYMNPDPKRKRKLLLHKREIEKLATKIQRSGATCVPLSIYFKGPRVKVQIALVTGKKLHDKRDAMRERELTKEARVEMKAARRT